MGTEQLNITAPIYPFPSLSWFKNILNSDVVQLKANQQFQKMTYHNKYVITTDKGLLSLSLPLKNGRNQRSSINEIQLFNQDQWQIKQWRTLQSAYGKAPYFEHYAPSLKLIYDCDFENLIDFSYQSILWSCTQLKWKKDIVMCVNDSKYNELHFVDSYKKEQLLGNQYYQIFEDKNGFIPNLSIIDLIFNEGPNATLIIKDMSS